MQVRDANSTMDTRITPSDPAALLRRFATGDHQSFTDLVDQFWPLVYRSAQRQLGHNHPDLDDAAQAVFLILAQKSDRVAERPLAPWLMATCRNVVATIRRAEQNRRRHERRSQEMVPMQTPSSSIAEDWPEELTGGLDDAIAQLPRRQREAIIVHYLQGMDRDQAAKHIGCSIEALHKRLQKGIDLLRRSLGRGSARTISSTMLIGYLTSQASAATPPAGLAHMAAASTLNDNLSASATWPKRRSHTVVISH